MQGWFKTGAFLTSRVCLVHKKGRTVAGRFQDPTGAVVLNDLLLLAHIDQNNYWLLVVETHNPQPPKSRLSFFVRKKKLLVLFQF